MAHNTITATQPTTTGYAGAYTQSFIDTYSLSRATDVPIFGQQIYPQLFKNYGDGFLWLDFLRAARKEFTLNGRRLTAFTETFDERPITTSTAINTGAAGATIYFKVNASDYNSAGATYVRVGDSVAIPPEYITISGSQPQLAVHYRVMVASTSGTVGGLAAGTGADTVYTASPLNVLSTIAVQVPIGTKFTVAENTFAPGSGPVSGLVRNELQYSFDTTIEKEGGVIEGGANAFTYQINGVPRMWNKMQIDAERRLDRKMDYAITNGQRNTNTSVVVETSAADNASRAVLSTTGILQWVADYGMDLPITNGSSFEFDDFDAIRELLEAKGVTTGNLTFGAATTLYGQVENCPFAWVDASHSPGTDLHSDMDKFGINFRRFVRNSYNVTLTEISSLTRKTGYGAIDAMKMQGLIIPDSMANVSVETGYGDRKKLSLPNFALGYLEGRRRIVQPRAGVNEFGYTNSDGYDRAAMDWLTEFMVFVMDFDKMIHVYEAAAAS